MQQQEWEALHEAEIEIAPEKCPGPSKETKNFAYLVNAGNAVVPSDTLKELEQIQMPPSKKELQELMGTLGYWRNLVPGFSVIARISGSIVLCCVTLQTLDKNEHRHFLNFLKIMFSETF